MNHTTRTFLVGILLLYCSASLAEQPPENPKKSAPIEEPKRFVTGHEIVLESGTLTYTATAAEIFLKDDKGKPTASIFSVAYTKDGVEDYSTRPVTFAFNGGPGSSAVWLQLGLLGPKRLRVPSDGTGVGAPPYRLEDNPLTLLATSDVVFIDPVGTGYSRALGEHKDEEFWGVDEDTSSVGAFIRSFLTENDRWNSPKLLAGES